MARLAFTTFAIMKAAYGNAVVHGFEALTPGVFRRAEQAPGFIDRARPVDDHEHLHNFDRDWGAWGRFSVPRFYDGGFETATDTRASTLSLWESVEAVRQFAYSGLHNTALRQREKWFRPPEWPTYAAWWVDDGYVPTWEEACRRLERLHDHGPTPEAFDLRNPFDSSGHPIAHAATENV